MRTKQADGGGSHEGVALIEAGLEKLAAEPLSGAVSDAALWASIKGLRRVGCGVEAETARRVAEYDDRQAYVGKARSTADVLAEELNLTRGEAPAFTKTAAALTRLPETAGKLARGELDAGRVREAAKALGELDTAADAGAAVSPDAVEQLDQLTAGAGATENRTQLRRRLQSHTEAATDGHALAEKERAAHANGGAWIGAGRFGGKRLGTGGP